MSHQFLRTALVALCLVCCDIIAAKPTAAQPFRNPSLPTETRIDDLISRLTIEEKANLLMHYSPAVDRLGLHQFQWWGEALHGVGFSGFATVFPEPIGMAASFDDQLLYRVFSAVSTEQRAKYNKAAATGSFDTFQSVSVWTPNVNIFRDPRWGRGQETYGEDPYLTSRMGQSVVRGLQGADFAPLTATSVQRRYYKTLACAKHYAVHSGPEWSRHRIDIDNISARDLWETYLPAFRDLVQKADVREVMCAYNSVDGEPCCSSARLLQQILRQEWGFTGLVVSDCDAINDIWVEGHHGIEPDVAHASARGIAGGTDLNCGGSYTSLPEAVSKGLVSQQRVDKSLRRVLRASKRRQPEVMLSRRSKPGPGRPNHVCLQEQKVEEFPARHLPRRAQPYVRRVHSSRDLVPGLPEPVINAPRVRSVCFDLFPDLFLSFV